MNINFNVYAPQKTNFSALKNQNHQKVSFTHDYLDIHNIKREQAKREFYDVIVPEANEELDNIEREADKASSIYYNMLNAGVEAYRLGEHKVATLSKKRIGLFKTEKIIKIYEGRNLAREISIFSCNHSKIKKYNNDGTYDLYECNYIDHTAKCCKNVKEQKTQDYYRYDADKIYEFKGRFLDKYEEGYHLEENEDNKEVYVQKSYEIFDDQIKRCKYLEGALYGYPMMSKSLELQECVACIKF